MNAAILSLFKLKISEIGRRNILEVGALAEYKEKKIAARGKKKSEEGWSVME